MGKRDLQGGQRAGRGRRPLNGSPIMANPRPPRPATPGIPASWGSHKLINSSPQGTLPDNIYAWTYY